MGDLLRMKRIAAALCAIVLLIASSAFVLPASAAKAKNIDYVEAQYFAAAPTIDGYISEAEWGEYTVLVEATDCETKNGSSPWKFFLYWRTGEKSDYSSWYYYLWLRWDENYFYIGLKNYDPDVHSLKNGTTNTWDGDALQTRIDPMGPNASVQGEEFTVTADVQKPWSGEKNVPDFLFGYVEIAGGFSEGWENTTNKGITSFSKNILGAAPTVVAPAGSDYSTDTKAGITTYEIAIPWSYMKLVDRIGDPVTKLTYEKYNFMRKPEGGIGREFGMSVAVLDDGNNSDPKWDAFMTWGSGICNAQQEEGAKTCTGSNSVTLSDKQYTPQAGYKTYDPSSLLDAKFGDENKDPMNVYYDYLAGDTYKENPISYDQLSVLKYDSDSDLSIWGAPEYNGKITDIGGDHGNVLDYRFTDPVQTYIDTRDGDMLNYSGINTESQEQSEDQKKVLEALGLTEIQTVIDQADAAVGDERIELFAKAEAMLLTDGILRPYSTAGGSLAVSRVKPFSAAYGMYGQASYNAVPYFKYMQLLDEPVTSADYYAAKEAWLKGE